MEGSFQLLIACEVQKQSKKNLQKKFKKRFIISVFFHRFQYKRTDGHLYRKAKYDKNFSKAI